MTLPQLIALGDHAILWLTMWAEGRGDSAEGHSSVEERIAIGCVIRNRVNTPHRFDKTYAQVCLAPRQFSCWQVIDGAVNHQAVLALAAQLQAGTLQPFDPLCRETMFLARGILTGDLVDHTNGAAHYVTTALAMSAQAPAWVRQVPVTDRLVIGSQVFLRNA